MDKSKDANCERVNGLLASLTPEEAIALRKRFNLDGAPLLDQQDRYLKALARELAMLRKTRC